MERGGRALLELDDMSDSERGTRGRLAAGDSVMFIDRKRRRYLRTLRSGAKISLRDGTIEADALIGSEDGIRIANSANETFLVHGGSGGIELTSQKTAVRGRFEETVRLAWLLPQSLSLLGYSTPRFGPSRVARFFTTEKIGNN